LSWWLGPPLSLSALADIDDARIGRPTAPPAAILPATAADIPRKCLRAKLGNPTRFKSDMNTPYTNAKPNLNLHDIPDIGKSELKKLYG
jgi:hypothetical protein